MKNCINHIQTNPLIIIDGSAYLYRAYYALPFLSNSIGESTSAIYGVINMIHSLFIKYHPTHAAIVFDTKGKTFRNELFEQYKLNRTSMPDNLLTQIKPLYSIIKAMGLPLISISGIEADDIIGTLACNAEKIGIPSLISSSDKDMAQLVSSKIKLIKNDMTHSILGPKEIMNKYGILPERMSDYLALVGDASDNIPGVPGIGKKTAQILLHEFGNLDKLYANIENIANLHFHGAKKIASKLKYNKELAYISYHLAKIRTDIQLKLCFEHLKIQKPVKEELIKLFKKYDFHRWITKLQSGKWLHTYYK